MAMRWIASAALGMVVAACGAETPYQSDLFSTKPALKMLEDLSADEM